MKPNPKTVKKITGIPVRKSIFFKVPAEMLDDAPQSLAQWIEANYRSRVDKPGRDAVVTFDRINDDFIQNRWTCRVTYTQLKSHKPKVLR